MPREHRCLWKQVRTFAHKREIYQLCLPVNLFAYTQVGNHNYVYLLCKLFTKSQVGKSRYSWRTSPKVHTTQCESLFQVHLTHSPSLRRTRFIHCRSALNRESLLHKQHDRMASPRGWHRTRLLTSSDTDLVTVRSTVVVPTFVSGGSVSASPDVSFLCRYC